MYDYVCIFFAGVFAAFDLYGQCVQVSIVSEDRADADFARRTSSMESLIDESMLGQCNWLQYLYLHVCADLLRK